MAISFKGVGSWATSTTTSITPALPTHAAGDLILIRVFRKPYTGSAMSTATSGWAAIGSSYTNGTTANGVGVGSMMIQAFYKVAESSSETMPQIDFGATGAPGAAVAVVYQKASGDTWQTPTGVGGVDSTAATTVNDTFGTHISVDTGDMVDFFAGWTDDSGTPSAMSISQTGVTYTVTGDIPATALDTATSNDLAADGGYALATAGPSSAAATITASYGSSEQHIVWMTRLRVTPPDPTPLYDLMLDEAPKLLIKGDESSGTTAYDSSGYGHDGTLSGSASFGGGTLVADGSSIDLTGGYISISDHSDFNSASEWTFVIVIDDDTTGGDRVLADFGDWGLYKTGSYISTFQGATPGTIDWTYGPMSPNDTNRHMFAVVHSGNGSTDPIYQDGTNIRNGGGSVTIGDNSDSIIIGALSGGSTPFDGRVAYIFYVDRALSESTLDAFYDAIDVVASGTDAPAGNAAGTGAANAATAAIKPSAGNAAGTGAANAPTPAITLTAGNAAGTGAAYSATVRASLTGGNAAGTGAANAPTAQLTVSAGYASGTGAAYDATVSTTSSTTAPAELASGTGAAYDATVRVTFSAGLATGTGAANAATGGVGASPSAATGTGSANGISVALAAPAGAATGTGAANDATVLSVNLPARIIRAVRRHLPSQLGGPRVDFGLSISPEAGVASAGNAAGTGTAHDPTVVITLSAGVASGTGAAYDATVSTSVSAVATPGAASGTGVAYDATVRVTAPAGYATGTGATYDATVDSLDGGIVTGSATVTFADYYTASIDFPTPHEAVLTGMATQYDRDDTTRPTATFKVSGTATDPTTVTLTVITPGKVSTDYTYGAAQLTKSSTGVYYRDITLDESGVWYFKFTGTGSCAASVEGTVTVRY